LTLVCRVGWVGAFAGFVACPSQTHKHPSSALHRPNPNSEPATPPQVVTKLEQVELLSQENDVLKLRSRVLEGAVEGREEQVRPPAPLDSSLAA